MGQTLETVANFMVLNRDLRLHEVERVFDHLLRQVEDKDGGARAQSSGHGGISRVRAARQARSVHSL